MSAIAATPVAEELTDRFSMKTYARMPVQFVKGQGTKLWDHEGNEYLDLFSGIGVCGLGHCHPTVVDAVIQQACTLMHVSNLFQTVPQTKLAEKLCALTGSDKVFFSNSGSEANETAIKLARKWGRNHKGPTATQIVALKRSFHGRTMGALAATSNPHYKEPFQPLPQGFVFVDAEDLDALSAALSNNVCALILEPIQGEGGVNVLSQPFLKSAYSLCKERNALFMVDEVQSGVGRTGKFLAIDYSGIQPDVITMAKGLANGIPIGACLASGEAANVLQPGDHGSTFGGNPVACAAALAVLNAIEDGGLIQKAESSGKLFVSLLEAMSDQFDGWVTNVRGVGLMIGVELSAPVAKKVMQMLLKKGIVVGTAGESVIRLLPPLVISEREIRRGVAEIASVLSVLQGEQE